MDPITPTTSSLTDLTAAASVAATSRVATPPTATPDPNVQIDTNAGSTPTDKVQISLEGTQAAKYVQQARAVAPLDEKTIKQLKAAIARGNYPPPTLIQGLINLVGVGFRS